ncbi:MAG TPA: hypothetical protein DIT99_30085 [Candidatus Latescibacteria bacterium]|nr:hypothetical protein [Candidatus Latescibacterota bacterium]
MLTFLVRTVIATIGMRLIRGAVSYMASSLIRPQNRSRQTPPSPSRPPRIDIDRKNIVDAKFEEVSDKE